MTINENAKKLINLLIDNGYKAYAVGGCVRNSILGIDVNDVDITTSAMPWEVEAVLNDSGINFFETGLKHGTITAVVNKENFEITTFRADGEYLDNRHPESVEFVRDLEDDLARRDFTVNALAYNENEGIIDIFGGVKDIENKIIRAVGDPVKRFNEDGLRIMRALRFASVLGFVIEENTKKAIFDCKELLHNIAWERLFSELVKLIMGDGAEQILLEYKEVIAVIIPEFKKCFDYPQNSKWHLYDVYTHIVKSVALAPKKDYIRLALLFHDIGKPECKTTDDKGQDHFKGHPEISANYAREILNRFKTSNEIKNKVVKLVELHDYHISIKHSNIKKWLRKLGDEFTLDFIDVKIADLKSHNLELSQVEIDELIEIREETVKVINSGEPYRISDLVINGSDLVELGYSGREIQNELEKLINDVSGSPKCNNRDWLIKQAKKDLD